MFSKFLSYFWPITRKIDSEFNGRLEVTWYNGKKLLDSQHTNYSYGNLQKVLTYGLNQIDFNRDEEVLILGMGAGSIISVLRDKFEYRQKITTVEVDKTIIALAKDEFGISAIENLEIYHNDAYEYVKTCDKRFGLILIDIFIDVSVPSKFYTKEFWNNLLPLLNAKGKILFNTGLLKEVEKPIENLEKVFDNELSFRYLNNPDFPNKLVEVSSANS